MKSVKLGICTISLLTFLFSSAISFACTGLQLKGEDGTVVFGRTQEWGKFDLNPKMIAVPRGHAFVGQTPDGQKGLSWSGEYGFVGVLLMGRAVNTGMNEKGLAGGGFFHKGFAEYSPYDPAKADKSLAPSQVLTFILSNFASLKEVRAGLQKVKVAPVVDPALKMPYPIHFMIVEPGGKSLVVEFKDGQLRFFDNPVGVITNNPTFDWHLTNLRNYGKLGVKPFEPKQWGELMITPLAGGSGLLGLPGDFTSPSRFVRATVFACTARHTRGGEDTVQEFFRIMDSFNLAAGQAEGSDPGGKTKLPASTQYTVANDTNNLIIYYHTMFNRRVRKILLNKIDFTRSGTREIPLDEKRVQDIKNVTKGLK
ncbi:linear amide C-N hydrolase [Dethiosulfatarculus sandiegensis]|uniref:Choloylglycine hydrolase n=1 Tax=Dethiosulfatarculus sandiegensis TaxID=1429043 RepID=A0A0D2JRL6_9BACT|nr:linear amide C-N hydrolase [Dethiosulfatarculus sandiegensis]KIX12145.1 choloylglycine hydrolase [Dethiosulfatarculus sandiegensis]